MKVFLRYQPRLEQASSAGTLALAVDCELPDQGITAISGPSGSGKTSLLRCVAGLEQAQQARIVVENQVWEDSDTGVRLPTWQRPIGYVFQEASLFEHLNVQENLQFGLQRAQKLHKHSDAKQVLQEAIELLGIETLLNRSVDRLSGGERQRVALARALATQPRLVLLDEPLAALDEERKAEVMPWLERLKQNAQVPILYVTHSTAEVARLADFWMVMRAGQVERSGPLEAMLAQRSDHAHESLDISSVFHAIVAEHDAQWQLTRVVLQASSGLSKPIAASPADPGLWIRSTNPPLSVGSPVRIRLLAQDVSISLERPTGSSIQNLLPAVIDAIEDDHHPAQCLIRLQVNPATQTAGHRVVARVSKRAVHQLKLQPAMSVWLQIKAASLLD